MEDLSFSGETLPLPSIYLLSSSENRFENVREDGFELIEIEEKLPPFDIVGEQHFCRALFRSPHSSLETWIFRMKFNERCTLSKEISKNEFVLSSRNFVSGDETLITKDFFMKKIGETSIPIVIHNEKECIVLSLEKLLPIQFFRNLMEYDGEKKIYFLNIPFEFETVNLFAILHSSLFPDKNTGVVSRMAFLNEGYLLIKYFCLKMENFFLNKIFLRESDIPSITPESAVSKYHVDRIISLMEKLEYTFVVFSFEKRYNYESGILPEEMIVDVLKSSENFPEIPSLLENLKKELVGKEITESYGGRFNLIFVTQ